MGANAPVLAITGQVPSEFMGRGRGHLHELQDQMATMRTLVKWTGRINRPQDAFAVIDEAFHQMTTGRPGPVVVEMCWDLLAKVEDCSIPPLIPRPIARELLEANVGAIEAFVKMVSSSKRPMILCGSGAQKAAKEIQELSKLLTAPVAGFRGGRGIVPEFHPSENGPSSPPAGEPMGISSYAAANLFPHCDLIIGVGTRLEMPFMRWDMKMNFLVNRSDDPRLTAGSGRRIQFVRIEIDAEESARLSCDLNIVGDSKVVVKQLVDAVKAAALKEKDSYRADVFKAVSEAHARTAVVQPQTSFLQSIRSVLPADGIFVEELSQVGFASYFNYPVQKPRTYISPGFQGTLGFGFMTSLGVKVANPNVPVVSITGDGGFLFGVMELASAVQENIGVVVILFNNSSYGNVVRDQDRGFGGRRIGSVFKPVRYAEVASGMGFEEGAVHVVDSTGITHDSEKFKPKIVEFEAALEKAVAWSNGGEDGHGKGPSMIEVVQDTGGEASGWDFIMPKLDWA